MTNQPPGFQVVLQRIKGYGGGEQRFKMGAANKACEHAILQQQQRVALRGQAQQRGQVTLVWRMAQGIQHQKFLKRHYGVVAGQFTAQFVRRQHLGIQHPIGHLTQPAFLQRSLAQITPLHVIQRQYAESGDIIARQNLFRLLARQ
ncbi:solute carrier family 40 member 1 [Lasius niger]|uniref:Solute carrier family 40 member 1 n=1 Tax=Lasius niger TaxID=67767 RepID=A0A0J7JX99_LASNI|nr:solute carrier family 40 member 1 [Lasius niger]